MKIIFKTIKQAYTEYFKNLNIRHSVALALIAICIVTIISPLVFMSQAFAATSIGDVDSTLLSDGLQDALEDNVTEITAHEYKVLEQEYLALQEQNKSLQIIYAQTKREKDRLETQLNNKAETTEIEDQDVPLSESPVEEAGDEEYPEIVTDEIKATPVSTVDSEAVVDPTQHLTKSGGVFWFGEQKETWYDLDMSKIVIMMRDRGFDEETYPYWVREDGCKMLGQYIMVAANLDTHPRGSFVETSLGTGLVCDTGDFAKSNALQIDIATDWN